MPPTMGTLHEGAPGDPAVQMWPEPYEGLGRRRATGALGAESVSGNVHFASSTVMLNLGFTFEELYLGCLHHRQVCLGLYRTDPATLYDYVCTKPAKVGGWVGGVLLPREGGGSRWRLMRCRASSGWGAPATRSGRAGQGGWVGGWG